MKRNFDFLSTLSDFAVLYNYCNEAELNQKSDPKQSALNARFALEYTVKIIYILHNWVIPKRSSLFELVDNEDFRRFINDNELMVALHYIRRAGNNAAHLEKVTAKESLFALLNLHSFVSAVLVKLGEVTNVATFDQTLLTENKNSTSKTSATIEEPQKKVINKYREQITVHDTLNAKNPQYFDEAETRSIYIDQQLREAGWEVLAKKNTITPSKACIEIIVEGMPSNSGEGRIDYVLFGRNRVPLALIEAKKTSKNVSVGKHQATLYADCLEKNMVFALLFIVVMVMKPI